MGASHRRIAHIAALAIVAGLFAINVYRAATQSFTCDEAFSCKLYMDAPIGRALTTFHANNHVLYTFLSRAAAGLFGRSEFALRITSLLGGLLYLIFAYLFSRRLFSSPWIMLLSVATLTLNPFVLDYLSVARGYGMALGLFMAALYCIIAALDRSDWEGGAKQFGRASFLLGLSVASNLAFLFPSVALASILTAAWMADSEDQSVTRKLGRAIETCWSPMIVTAFIVLVIPLSHSHRDDFVAGEDSMHQASVSVVQPSLFHRYDLAGFAPLGDQATRVRDFISDWVVLIVLLTLTGWLARVLAIWLQTRRIRTLDSLDRVSLVVNATVLLSLAGVIAGHSIGGLRYPAGRTAIYFVPLIGLAWLTLAARLNGKKAVAICLPAIAAVTAFLYGFTTQYYFEWRYDAGTARIFTLLKEQGSHRPARLGVSWALQATSNYYRQRYRLDWIQPVTDAPMDRGGFDFYILLLPDDRSTLDRVPFKILYRDPISGEELGVPLP